MSDRYYSIPVIVSVREPNREEAENRVDDIADSMGEVFGVDAWAIVGADHNILDRLGIDPEGEEIE